MRRRPTAALIGSVVAVALGSAVTLYVAASSTVSTPELVERSNAEASARLVAWQQAFEAYRRAEGVLPDVPDGVYCLGRGFPVGGDGVAGCGAFDAPAHPAEDASGDLWSALSTVGPVPDGVSRPVGGVIGPYAVFSSSRIDLITPEQDGCTPPARTLEADLRGRHLCMITLDR